MSFFVRKVVSKNNTWGSELVEEKIRPYEPIKKIGFHEKDVYDFLMKNNPDRKDVVLETEEEYKEKTKNLFQRKSSNIKFALDNYLRDFKHMKEQDEIKEQKFQHYERLFLHKLQHEKEFQLYYIRHDYPKFYTWDEDIAKEKEEYIRKKKEREHERSIDYSKPSEYEIQLQKELKEALEREAKQ